MRKRRHEETKKQSNEETQKRRRRKRRNEETQKRRNEEVKKRRNDSKNLEGRQTGQMEGHHIVSVAATHSWPEVLKAARAVKHFGWSGFRAKELILDLVPTCSPQWILPCWAGLASRPQPMACSPSVARCLEDWHCNTTFGRTFGLIPAKTPLQASRAIAGRGHACWQVGPVSGGSGLGMEGLRGALAPAAGRENDE